ncbi:MAG TPA: hypothetical protein VNZ86_20190 [Bacteroidia bacterium]|jgi:hypothetical protein|nr:hypothetical protein [Bacteroidia bacterium]
MASDHLFRLIQSLSKNEKVYIKRSASLHRIGGKNKYIKFFDLLCRMKEYDERVILKKFAGDPFFNNISAAKNYLLNYILHVLESYHQSAYSEIRSCLHQVEILEDKGLIDLCRKKIARAEHLAVKYQWVEQLFSIYSWKYHLYPEGLKKDDYLDYMTALGDKIQESISDLKEYADVKSEFYKGVAKALYLDPRGLEMNRQVVLAEIARVETRDPETFHSFYAKYNYLLLLRILYSSIGKHTESLRYVNQMHELFLGSPHMIGLELYNFLFNLREKMYYEVQSGQSEKILHSFRMLDELCTEYGAHKKIVWLLLHNMKFSLCIRFGEFQSARRHAAESQKVFRKIESSEIYAEEQKFFLIRSAVLYLGLEDYRESLKYINEALEISAHEMIGDLNYFAQIFQLIIYYEKGESELIEYRSRAVYRTLLRRKRKFHAEKVLVDFFRRELDEDEPQSKIPAFKALKSTLADVFETHPEEKVVLRFFDIMDWIQCKIEKLSLPELLYKKNTKLLETDAGKKLLTYLKEE